MAWVVCLWGWVPTNCWAALSCCLWGCCLSSKQLLLLAWVLSSCVWSCGLGFQAVVVGEAAWLALVAPCASPRPLRRSRSTQEITGSCSCRQPTCLSLSSSFSKLSTWFSRSQAYTRCNHEMDVAQKRVCSTCSGGGTLTLEVVRRRSSWHLDLRKVSKQDLSAIVKMFKLLQLQYLLHICNNK